MLSYILYNANQLLYIAVLILIIRYWFFLIDFVFFIIAVYKIAAEFATFVNFYLYRVIAEKVIGVFDFVN